MAGMADLEQNMRAPVSGVTRASTNDPTEVDAARGYCAGMTDALQRLRSGRRGPVSDADRPPPSLFPSTPASRAALRYKT